MEEDPEVFDIVWEILMEDRYPVSMRAAWSISILASRNPSRVQSRLPGIVAFLPSAASKGVKRSLLKILTMVPLPAEQTGFLFDFCFGIMESSSAEIAHKAYAMAILYNISEQEPALKPELISLFETCLQEESSGIQARGRILLGRLHKDLSHPSA